MSEAVSRALLLTDVVGSVRLGESLGERRMAEVWRAHDRVARDLLESRCGCEIDRSDGFLLLFERAADAVAYALAYHGALRELSASLGIELEARAGLHVGEVVLRENPFEDVRRGAKPLEVEGMAKPLAARVMALGRGGQTLLTPAARGELDGVLPEGAELVSHGHYRLKGLLEPVELSELGFRGEAPLAPPEDGAKAYRVVLSGELWRPVKEVPHTLPAECDAFVGRRAELAELAQRLDAGARLVTVLGPGGTGKTRLVRRYGWTWLGDWPGGVWFADLSEARSVDGMAHAVASALGVALGGEDPVVQLGHAIAGRGRCLVVLDNFEQLVTHAEATLGRWLEQAEEAAFVVTSRERLHIRGEDVMPLEPLEPEGEGVQLFELRARSHEPGFALTPESLSQVQEVVRLLDGLPLAIELAAARVRVLSPGQILERMEDRFKLLVGARGASARQATLRVAIDWSWGLLEPWEQAVLAQASVFAGGFTLEAAEAVFLLEGFAEAPWAIDVVQSLVDKSLLRKWTVVSGPRLEIEEPYFGMYLSIEEYAREKLRTAGAIEGASGAEAERSAEERHGAYFAALADHGGVAEHRTLAQELDNLMAATNRALGREDLATAAACYLGAWAVLELQGPFSAAVELGRAVLTREGLERATRGQIETSLGRVLRAAGRLEEAREHWEAALAIAREVGNRNSECQVLGDLGTLNSVQGRVQEAREHYEAALALYRELGNRSGEASILCIQGSLYQQQGRLEDAREHHEAALVLYRELEDRRGEGVVLGNLGLVHGAQGRMEEAREHHEAALAIARDFNKRSDEGAGLCNLGIVHSAQGRMEEAREHYEAALAIFREVGNRHFEGNALAGLGLLQVEQGRLEEGQEHCEAALVIAREVGNRSGEGEALDVLGRLHAKRGRMEEAREHWEAALAVARELGDGRGEGLALGNLGRLELALGNREQAAAALARGEGLLREAGDRSALGGLLCSRGELERVGGGLDAARACLEEAASLATETGAALDSELGRAVAELRDALGDA